MLFKDEVRKLGNSWVYQRSWSGASLSGSGPGVRVLGEVTPEKVEILREADAIVTEEMARAGLERKVWQYFAVLPSVRSVGMREGERTYAYPIIVRAVNSENAMTADWRGCRMNCWM